MVECKKAHGRKVMFWVEFVNNIGPPVVRLDGFVTSYLYLSDVSQVSVWRLSTMPPKNGTTGFNKTVPVAM